MFRGRGTVGKVLIRIAVVHHDYLLKIQKACCEVRLCEFTVNLGLVRILGRAIFEIEVFWDMARSSARGGGDALLQGVAIDHGHNLGARAVDHQPDVVVKLATS